MAVRAFTIEDGRAFLAAHDLLGHLSPAELDRLLSQAHVVHRAPGETLFRKGDPGDRLYVLLSGRIKIGAVSPQGQEIVFNVLGSGEVFGEIAVLDGKTRTADAATLTDCDFLEIGRNAIIPFLQNNPEVAARLIAVLCERVRWISQSHEDALVLDLAAHLARKLVVLMGSYGRSDPRGGVRIDLRLSQKDLAAMTGVSRESVNKLLRRWQDEGIVAHSDGCITVIDIPRLSEVAERR